MDRDRRVLVTLPTGMRSGFFDAATIDRLESMAEVDWNERDEQFDPEELGERLAGVDAVVTGWGTPQLSESVLAEADDLGLLAHTGGSVATYVSDTLFDRGVSVCSANRPMARHVAECTLGHVLSARRGIAREHETIREGGYGSDQDHESLFDATVGIVGLGTIGRYLLPLLEPFDVHVKAYDPYVPPAEITEYGFVEKAGLTEAMEDADVVSIHAPRTPETIGMIGEAELAAMPDGALLVNTARAAIVDEEAMLSELESGRIDAALDVFHEEPLREDSPLRDLDNVQLTPHVGGLGPHEVFGATMVDELERFFEGRTLQHEIPREQAVKMTQ